MVVHKEFSLTIIAPVDSGADMNYIKEGLIPSKYYESTTDRLTQANGDCKVEFNQPCVGFIP